MASDTLGHRTTRIDRVAHHHHRAIFATVLAVSLCASGASAQDGDALSRPPNDGAPLAANVSPLGHYGASVPLALPSPRGLDLEVPLAVRYTGGPEVGAAGRGWDVPYGYVRQTRSLAGRKPQNAIPGRPRPPLAPPLRTYASLGGAATLMNPTAARDHYRPALAGSFAELVGPDANDRWTATDGQGRTFRFEKPAGLGDDTLWVLTRVTDRTGRNYIEIDYDVSWVQPTSGVDPVGGLGSGWAAGSGALPELLVTELRYAHTASGCAKHRIELSYVAPRWLDRGTLLALQVAEGSVRGRTRLLDAITVYSQASATCTEPVELARYDFRYEPDRDTNLPLLAAVSSRGRADRPVRDTKPAAAYTYGDTSRADRTLQFAAQPSMTLPEARFGSDLRRSIGSWYKYRPNSVIMSHGEVRTLADFTGDGRPDVALVDDQGDDQLLSIAVNRSDSSGTPSFSALETLLDEDDGHAYLDHEDTARSTSGLRRRTIDWNGDGRTDILSVPQPGSGPEIWVLLLNRPAGIGDRVRWERLDIDVSDLRAYVHGSLRVDLRRTYQTTNIRTQRCRTYEQDSRTGQWIRRDTCSETQEETKHQLVAWDLIDVNGDSLPDFVFNTDQIAYTRLGGNAEPSSVTPTCEVSYCPETASSRSDIPAACFGTCTDIATNQPALDNQIMVVYNRGGTMRAFSDPAVPLMTAGAWCGVGQTELAGETGSYTHMRCGFADVNGDGLVDYIVDDAGPYAGSSDPPAPRALLGNGEPGGFSEHRSFLLPAPLTITWDGRNHACTSGGADRYSRSQYSTLADLNADGIPDFVWYGSRTEVVGGYAMLDPGGPSGASTARWWLRPGTGTGFAAAQRIETDAVPFAIHETSEQCDGYLSITVARLVDLDADGGADLASTVGDRIRVASVVTERGALAGLESARLLRIDNGYGGATELHYGNAKREPFGHHEVPFPEIVVTEVKTLGRFGLGGDRASVHYAYGGARLRYDPLAGRWTFPGYERVVTLRGLPDNNGKLIGRAEVVDAIPVGSAMAGRGYSQYALEGRPYKTTRLAGVFATDPKQLLSIDVATDARWRGDDTLAEQAHAEQSSVSSAEYGDCWPVTDDATALQDTLPSLCRAVGHIRTSSRVVREGESPSAGRHVATEIRFQQFDQYGRPAVVMRENDRNDSDRYDDDTCTRYVYAVPSGTLTILDAVATTTTYDCRRPERILARTEHQYDDLPIGQVSRGLMTHGWVEERTTDGGGLVRRFLAEQRRFDAFGNILRVDSDRTVGGAATRTTEFGYDSFGLAPRTRTDHATGAPTMTASFRYDPVSRSLDEVSDLDGTRSFYYDERGRPIATTISPHGSDVEYLLDTRLYFDSPTSRAGRQVEVRSYRDGAEYATSSADYTATTVHFDEFGQTRHANTQLGADYGARVMISDYVERDLLGRPAFVADPYVLGEQIARVYGTTFFYDEQGRVRCSVRAAGRLDAAPSATNAADAVFPTCYDYVVVGGRHVTTVKGPSELDPADSERFGAFSQTTYSGIGRVTQRKRAKGNRVFAYSELEYDALGQPTTIRRFANGTTGTATEWRFRHDSLGRMIESVEPETAAKTFVYSEWGELAETRWYDPVLRVIRKTTTTYDGASRPLQERAVTNARDEADASVTYQYEARASAPAHAGARNLAGRLAWVEDSVTRSYFSYDDFGRAEWTARVNKADGGVYRESVALTPQGELDTIELSHPDAPDGERIHYMRDSAGRMKNVVWQDAWETVDLLTATSIDPRGRYTGVLFGNGVSEARGYRASQRRELQTVRVDANGDTLFSYLHGFDGDGRLLGRTDTRAGTPRARSSRYSYGADQRLARSETQGEGGALVFDESYGYDGLGNLRSITDRLGSDDRYYARDAADPDRVCSEIGTFTLTAGAVAPPCAYRYDGLGNTLRTADQYGATRTFSYDVHNRLRSALKGSARADLHYDAFGQLAELDYVGGDSGENRQEQRYGAIVSKVRALEGGRWQTRVERAIPGPFGVLAYRRGTGQTASTVYVHGDESARAFSDEDGTLVQQADFEPYGRTSYDDGDRLDVSYTRDLWQRNRALSELGIVLMGARAYDPRSGRFLQRDPLILERNSQQMSPYAFPYGDPINFTDPTGMDGEWLDAPESLDTFSDLVEQANESENSELTANTSCQDGGCLTVVHGMDMPIQEPVIEQSEAAALTVNGNQFLATADDYFLTYGDGPTHTVSEDAFYSALRVSSDRARMSPEVRAREAALSDLLDKTLTYGTIIVAGLASGGAGYLGWAAAGTRLVGTVTFTAARAAPFVPAATAAAATSAQTVQRYGPFWHVLNKGGLPDIAANQRLQSTAANNVAGAVDAVRAYIGPYVGTKSQQIVIEFMTRVAPDNYTIVLGERAARWFIEAGRYLPIEIVRIIHP